MTRVYYKDAHACLVMFDLTQKGTFQNSVKWKKDLDQKCTLMDGSPVPCLLLANKVSTRNYLPFYIPTCLCISYSLSISLKSCVGLKKVQVISQDLFV